MHKVFLLLSVLLANAAVAEEMPKDNAFACFAAGNIAFMSDNIYMNAMVKPVVSDWAKNGDELTIKPRDGIEIPFGLSDEQGEMSLLDLQKACDEQVNRLPQRNPVLTAAFNETGGLFCSKKDGAIQLSSDPKADGISINEVTGFDKKTPDQLTILVGAEYRGPYTLSPLQRKLPLNELLIGCGLKADEREPPIIKKSS